MQCPDCKSEHIRKNGKNKQDKQNYIAATNGKVDALLSQPVFSDYWRSRRMALQAVPTT
jgi:transposase-like protein